MSTVTSPTDEIVLLVSGGRQFQGVRVIHLALEGFRTRFGDPSLMIHGAATGVDQICDDWARCHDIPVDKMPADWEDLSHPDLRLGVGRGGRPIDLNAGKRRNGWMRDRRPTHFVHFPGQHGTKDMVSKMGEASKSYPVIILSYDELI